MFLPLRSPACSHRRAALFDSHQHHHPQAGQTSCLPHTNCEAGKYIIADPTSITNRVCGNCQLGSTFSTTVNQEQCVGVAVCGATAEELAVPTLSSDRICRACVQDVTYLDASTRSCRAVTTCSLGTTEVEAPTLSSDRECAVETFLCDNNLTPNSEACTCPDDDVCAECLRQPGSEDAINAILRLIGRQPSSVSQLGTCAKVASSMVQGAPSFAPQCATRCGNDARCVGFSIITSGAAAGDCCLYSSFFAESSFSQPGSEFYSMSQCEVCDAGYFKRGRQCAPLSQPPVIAGGDAPINVLVPLGAAAGTLLRTFTATFESGFGPVRWLETTENARFSIDAVAGTLSLNETLSTPASYQLRVAVRDTGRTECTELTPAGAVVTTARPFCVDSVVVTVQTAVFLSCPADQSLYLSPSETQASVAWTPPQLPAFLSSLAVTQDLGATASESSPYLYPAGVHDISYTSEPLDIGGSLRCAFTVSIRYGFSLQVQAVGRREGVKVTQDYLVVEAAESAQGARLPSFDGPLRADRDLNVGIFAPESKPFTVSPAAGNHVRLVVFMQWCQAGSSVSAALDDLDLGTLFLDLSSAGDSAAASRLTFEDAGSGISQDGGCIVLRGSTNSLAETVVLRSLNLRFVPGAADRRRRRADGPEANEANDDTLARARARRSGGAFLPVEPYQVAFETSAIDGGDLNGDGGSVSLSDDEPPVLLGCPTEPVVVAVAPGETDAVATWAEPTAIDNVVASPVITSTAEPGDTFTILGSPHVVTYTASDGSQTSQCAFEVQVTYDAVVRTYSSAVDASFPLQTVAVPARSQLRVTQALVGPGMPPLRTLAALDTSGFTELRLRLEAPAGRPVVIRTRADVLDAELVLNLVWRRAGAATVTPPPQSDIEAYIEFDGYALDTGAEVDRLPGDEVDSVLPATAALRVGELAVDPATGYIGIAGGRTDRFHRGISFTSLTLVVLVPSGRASAGGDASWTLSAESSLVVEYIYAEGDPSAAVGGFLALLDNQPPFFVLCDTAPLTVPTLAGENYTVPFWRQPIDGDNSGVTTLTSTRDLGSRFLLQPPGAPPVEVVYTSTDAFGNSAECRFTVEVVDTEPPAVSAPAPQLVLLPNETRTVTVMVPAELLRPASVSDNSDLPVTLLAPLADVELGVGLHEVPVRVRDAYGNEATVQASVAVVDVDPPQLTCPPDLRVAATGAQTQVLFGRITAEDNDYDGPRGVRPIALNVSRTSGDLFPEGATVVTASGFDLSGNEGRCSFTVEVIAAEAAASGVSASISGGAGAAGGVMLLLLIVAVVLLRRAHKRARQPQNWDDIFALLEQFNSADVQSGDGPRYPREIARGAVKLLGELGKGAFGVVYKAKLQESVDVPGYLVAAKSLHDRCTNGDRQELLEEAAVMAQFQSAFVTQLVGVVTVGKPLLVIVEYMENGSLKSYLEKNDVTLAQQLMWAGDVAAGLAHVIAKGFLHRDVATRNVLLSSEMRCKISDFGMAREVEDGEGAYYRSRGGQLPVRWSAPEALEDRKFNEKTDVYSYGVSLYEMWTRAVLPYDGWSNQKVWVQVAAGYRLPQPAGCSDEVYKVMHDCWLPEQSERPSFESLRKRFRLMYESETGEDLDATEYISIGDDESEGSSTLGGRLGRALSRVISFGGRRNSKGSNTVLNPVYAGPQGHISSGPSESTTSESGPLYDMGNGEALQSLPEGNEDDGGEAEDSAGALYDMGSGDANEQEEAPVQLQGRSLPGAVSGGESEPAAAAAAATATANTEELMGFAADDLYGNVDTTAGEGGEAAATSAPQGELTEADIGCRVSVQGYSCGGELRFVGLHKKGKGPRCGVALDEPQGLNNGTVGVSHGVGDGWWAGTFWNGHFRMQLHVLTLFVTSSFALFYLFAGRILL